MKKKAAEQVLCYHLEADVLETVRAVMRKLSIACRALPEESQREKVGFLLGKRGFRPRRKMTRRSLFFPTP